MRKDERDEFERLFYAHLVSKDKPAVDTPFLQVVKTRDGNVLIGVDLSKEDRAFLRSVGMRTR